MNGWQNSLVTKCHWRLSEGVWVPNRWRVPYTTWKTHFSLQHMSSRGWDGGCPARYGESHSWLSRGGTGFFLGHLASILVMYCFFLAILYYSELNVTAMRRAKSWSLSVIYIQWLGRSTNGSAGSESPCDCRGPKKNWSQLVSWPHSMLCTMLHAGCCICKCDISWTLSLGARATATGHNSGSRDGKGAQSISSQGMMHPALQSWFQNLGVQLSKLLAGPCIGGRAGARSCSAGGNMVRDSTRWPGMGSIISYIIPALFFWEDGSVFHLKSFEYIVCSFEYLKICESFVIWSHSNSDTKFVSAARDTCYDSWFITARVAMCLDPNRWSKEKSTPLFARCRPQSARSKWHGKTWGSGNTKLVAWQLDKHVSTASLREISQEQDTCWSCWFWKPRSGLLIVKAEQNIKQSVQGQTCHPRQGPLLCLERVMEWFWWLSRYRKALTPLVKLVAQ